MIDPDYYADAFSVISELIGAAALGSVPGTKAALLRADAVGRESVAQTMLDVATQAYRVAMWRSMPEPEDLLTPASLPDTADSCAVAVLLVDLIESSVPLSFEEKLARVLGRVFVQNDAAARCQASIEAALDGDVVAYQEATEHVPHSGVVNMQNSLVLRTLAALRSYYLLSDYSALDLSSTVRTVASGVLDDRGLEGLLPLLSPYIAQARPGILALRRFGPAVIAGLACSVTDDRASALRLVADAGSGMLAAATS